MQKIIFIVFLLPFIGCSQSKTLLQQDYSFLLTDGEVIKLHQSKDTLYELKCYIDRNCQPIPKSHYKIISSKSSRDFIILKLECLDTIPLTTNPYPETRYQQLALKLYDNRQLGYLQLSSGLSRQQLDKINTDVSSLKDKFFFTFFSDTYLKELTNFKKVTTKDEVKQIMETAQSEIFKKLVERYSKTQTNDMYASGLSSEILNRACIEKGFNPIGAGRALRLLMGQ